jgi:hypothetical protein
VEARGAGLGFGAAAGLAELEVPVVLAGAAAGALAGFAAAGALADVAEAVADGFAGADAIGVARGADGRDVV